MHSFSKNITAELCREGLINLKMTARVLGVLLLFEAVLLGIAGGVSLIYKEGDAIYFLYSILITVACGLGLMLYGRKAMKMMGRRDAYLIVGISWILFTLLGMLPFRLGNYIPSVTDAFFETMSGFTTTGASILDNIEALPHGLLFWRSLTQWIGGLGIVFFSMALLPIFGGSGQLLFMTEATGVKHIKVHPKVAVMARYIGSFYIVITCIEGVLLWVGGMEPFDAVCHAITTTATGGFSTKQASVAYWNSPFIEYVITVFMFISAVSFPLYVLALKGRFRTLFRDDELLWYMKSVLILTAVISLSLIFINQYDVEKAVRAAVFQVVSIHTSCGFATDDYAQWPQFTWPLLLFAMVAGGCTGSTGGGVKNMRLLIAFRAIRNQFRQILHPRAILPLKVSGQIMEPRILTTVLVFIVSYMTCLFLGWLLLMAMGLPFMEAFSTAVSAMGNTGPALGAYGPAYSWAAMPDAAKWLTSVLMLIGRLEIFGLLMAFYPGLWKEH
ncbi:MAG: TrkH family potassium uptake protein [Bacteroidales bacterium]|nr:TrkH family potassium uptake protein [Bacteroidales bacterium]